MGKLILLIYAKIFVAAICYTLAVVGSWSKGLSVTIKALFSTAFILDVWATMNMYSINPVAPLNPHGFMGIGALLCAASLQIIIVLHHLAARLNIYIPFQTRCEKMFISLSGIFLFVWYIAAFMGLITGIMHTQNYYPQ